MPAESHGIIDRVGGKRSSRSRLLSSLGDAFLSKTRIFEMEFPNMAQSFLDHDNIKMKDKKFQDFASVDKQAWMDQSKKDLKGGDFERQLVSMAMGGFPIHPYYAAEDTIDTQWIKAYDNRLS